MGWAIRADELGRELSPEEDGQAEGWFAGAKRSGGGRVGDPAGWPVVHEERQGTRGQLGPVHKGLSADFWPCAVGILSVGFCFFPAVESEKGSEDERCVEGPEAGVSGERGCFVLDVIILFPLVRYYLFPVLSRATACVPRHFLAALMSCGAGDCHPVASLPSDNRNCSLGGPSVGSVITAHSGLARGPLIADRVVLVSSERTPV